MARFRITAPRPITGKRLGVLFVDGVAEFDEAGNRPALAYFRRHADAYRVEALDAPDDQADGGEVDSDLPLPARNASTDEWRAYAVLAGMPEDEAAIKSRDELVAHYAPKEAGQ